MGLELVLENECKGAEGRIHVGQTRPCGADGQPGKPGYHYRPALLLLVPAAQLGWLSQQLTNLHEFPPRPGGPTGAGQLLAVNLGMA